MNWRFSCSGHLADLLQVALVELAVADALLALLAGEGEGGGDVADLAAVEAVVVAVLVDEAVDAAPVLDLVGLELVEEVLEDGLHLPRGAGPRTGSPGGCAR